MIWSIPLCYNVCCQKKDEEIRSKPWDVLPRAFMTLTFIIHR